MDISGLQMNLVNRDNWVAVIGSRNATAAELSMAGRVAYSLVQHGYIVVSGLALGIDAEAHKSAIQYGGKTIAIVNTPKFQQIYPAQNRRLAEEIKQHGCILHPFNTMAKEGGKSNNQFILRLLERDILLAKLCPKIIAVSDNEVITGGTRWATHYGQVFGKQVYRYASDGVYYENPTTEKCDQWWKMELDINNIV